MANTIYTAEAHVTGGRIDGHGRTSDGVLEVDLRLPNEMGGQGGGTNPEQLFAVGYAACFEGALASPAGARRSRPATSRSTRRSSLSPNGKGGFDLGVDARRLAAERRGRRRPRRRSCSSPTRSARTRTPRAATSRSRSPPTASRSTDRRGARAVRVLTWNLFHGRSQPAARRELLGEFAALLGGWSWDLALLQEVPPWWPAALAPAAAPSSGRRSPRATSGCRCGARWRGDTRS